MITKVLLGILIGVLAGGMCAQASVPVTLTDYLGPNSTVNIDPYTQAGVYEWLVDGTNHMTQNAYWFRIGGAGVASPISSIGTVSISQTMDFGATVLYTGSDFNFQITYSLMGADMGSGTSDLAQTMLIITNKTGSPLDMHLFEYVNMDLNGTASAETAVRNTSSSITQTDGATHGQLTVNTIPNHWEIGNASTLLGKLNTASFLNLADANSPYIGDSAFAFQWDMSIAVHNSLAIGQDNLIQGGKVPEPTSAMALVSMLGLLPLLRRKRR